jgi:uncharacterized protein (TIGR03435 family)
MKKVVESTLNLDVRIEKSARLVAVLKKKIGSPELTPSTALKSDYRVKNGNLTAIKQPMKILVDYLIGRGFLNVPIVDESGLKGEYDMELVWEEEAADSMEKALAKLGLELVSAEREIDMYVLKQKSN